MSYLFDLEDFDSFCRPFSDTTIKTMASEIKSNKYDYYQKNGTYDGYIPKQETLFFNSDGSISIYLYDSNFGVKKLFDFGQYCCVNKMAFIIGYAKEKLGLFSNIDLNTTNFIWDNNNQSCRWKPIVDSCTFDTYKIALNPVFDDGALFNVEKNDSSCNLTIDFITRKKS